MAIQREGDMKNQQEGVAESGEQRPPTSGSPPGHKETPALSSFFRPRVLIGVLGVTLVIVSASVMSRSGSPVVVPQLVGERVDAQLDVLRTRLEAADLVLGDVSIVQCPYVDIPGASLEALPGTIVDQLPSGGERVTSSTVVDVMVCLPGRR